MAVGRGRGRKGRDGEGVVGRRDKEGCGLIQDGSGF